MKISMKWMVLVGLLSASVACGDSIEKKIPTVEVDTSTTNNVNNDDDPNDEPPIKNTDDPGDDPDEDPQDPANDINNVDPTNNLNNQDPTNNQNNEDPTDNLNNVDPNEYRSIHVQLVWETPADGDPTDFNGTDLDVHLAHPLAAEDTGQPDKDGDGLPDPWFHDLYDCSWRNNSPDWGSAGDIHDPSQDIDDTDGTGPENINIAVPENVEYRIAAHYYDDKEFGQSIARVKVFVGGELVAEYENGLVRSDMWEVATIDGRTGEVTPVGRLTPDYSIDSPL